MTDTIVYLFKKSFFFTQKKQGKHNIGIRKLYSLRAKFPKESIWLQLISFLLVSRDSLLAALFSFFVSCKEHGQGAMAYCFTLRKVFVPRSFVNLSLA